jgi:predicted dehydrogenase
MNGFYDPNQENADKIAKEFDTNIFSTIATLIHAVDVIDIVTPTFTINVLKLPSNQETRFIETYF